MGRLVRWLQKTETNFFVISYGKIPMKVESAQYAVVQMVPPARAIPPRTKSLYVDEEDFKKIRKEFGHSSQYPKVELALCFRDDLDRISSPGLNIGRYSQTPAIDTYSRVGKDRGFRTYVGWLIDTIV
jgi:hypothetical protein